jgi:putative membrane protein
MMNWKLLIIRWAILAVAILVTAWIIPGIQIQGSGVMVAILVAVILGFANAIIRPILILLSCGCIVLTLGLFLLVVNAATLLITSWVSQRLGIGFYVNGFWPALLGSLVISVISFILSHILIGDEER